jgi:oxygen-independent coproporphyrinogen-3 oxidase
MQSANAAELQLFQRRHDVAMVAQAVQAARHADFTNLSLDLIYGIPHQTLSDWAHTLDTALSYTPQHISLYGLEFKGGTPLTKAVKQGKIPLPDDDLAADMYDLATERLAQAGLQQYEISNWSLAGYQAQHNLQYWRMLPYAGLGPGAHGCANHTRTIAIRQPEKYMNVLEAPAPKKYPFPRTPATSKAVQVDQAAEMADVLMMGLRLTHEGIQRATFQARFGVDVLELHRATLERFVALGMLYVDEQVVRLTAQGRLVSNAIIRELI